MSYTGSVIVGDGRTLDFVDGYAGDGVVDPYGEQIPQPQPICRASWDDPSYRLLNELYAQGKAAGWGAGFAYNNDDNGHVSISQGDMPAITFLWSYDRSNISYNGEITNPYFTPDPNTPGQLTPHANHVPLTRSGIVLGQASLSGNVSPALQQPASALLHWEYSRHNFRYFYPAHDQLNTGMDLIRAMMPSWGVSVGSSGSELPQVITYFFGAAALRPNVQAKLIADGRLWGVVDVAHRMARIGMDAARYLTGDAHRIAWSSSPSLVNMINYCNSITLDNIPPFTQIEILSEDFGQQDRLWAVPDAVSRYYSDNWPFHSITLQGYGFGTAPVSHRWARLSGDLGKIRIVPLSTDGSRVRIEIDYPGTYTGVFGPSNRIDLGYICWTDPQFPSQPSYISIYGAR